MSKTRPDDSAEIAESNEPLRAGSGSSPGKPAPPPATADERSVPPKEVTTIPIGTPDSEEAFRLRKERARRPVPAGDDVNVGSDQEE